MKNPVNVRANLEVVQKPLMTRSEFFDGIKPVKRSPFIEEDLDF